MTKLEQVKQVIQKANPEIMELKFGCEIRTKFDETWTITHRHKIGNIKECWGVANLRQGSLVSDEDIEVILGRPIRLADVLYAIGEPSQILTESEIDKRLKHIDIISKYNLLDDNLDHQSEDFINFAWEVLCK